MATITDGITIRTHTTKYLTTITPLAIIHLITRLNINVMIFLIISVIISSLLVVNFLNSLSIALKNYRKEHTKTDDEKLFEAFNQIWKD